MNDEDMRDIGGLREVAGTTLAFRRHVWACEDCADDEPCEEGMELYDEMLKACDRVFGHPRGTTE